MATHGSDRAEVVSSDVLEGLQLPVTKEVRDPELKKLRLVSLGCWCGVKMDFKWLGFGSETLPFDWAMTSMDGVLHFLNTGFQGFLDISSQELIPDSQGKMVYRSPVHSFWHDDPTSPEDIEKYQRRIVRFQSIDASNEPVLFVRVACRSEFAYEISKAETLVQTLRRLHGDEAHLLLILEDQEGGYRGASLVHEVDGLMLYFVPAQEYAEAIITGLVWIAERSFPARTLASLEQAEAMCIELPGGMRGKGGVEGFDTEVEVPNVWQPSDGIVDITLQWIESTMKAIGLHHDGFQRNPFLTCGPFTQCAPKAGP
mmetsp:Transcript_43902/g.80228  ORF Transcript_43902/g.80228 Transcript_43902/m.80228 type:complete len:314 (+) Transcript_43902:53-994(+)